METQSYTGLWTGEMSGTNIGGFSFEIDQSGDQTRGIAKFSEPALGQYEYAAVGIAGENLTLRLTPTWQSGGINLGIFTVVGHRVHFAYPGYYYARKKRWS